MSIELIRKKNLSYLLEEHGGQKELASLCETPANYFSQVKNGTRNLGSAVARRIEAKLGLKQGWMDSNDHDNLPLFSSGLNEIPQISLGQAAKWAPTTKPYPAHFSKRMQIDFKAGTRCYAVTVPDNSLEPEILEGSLIALDPDLPPAPGTLCAFQFPDVNNGFVIGKYTEVAGQKHLGFNQAFYPPIPIDKKAKYCGRAVYQFGRIL